MKTLFAAFIFGASVFAAPLMANDQNNMSSEDLRPTVQVQCYASATRGFQPLMRHAGISKRLRGGPGQFNRAKNQALRNAQRNCKQMHFRDSLVVCTALPNSCRKVR